MYNVFKIGKIQLRLHATFPLFIAGDAREESELLTWILYQMKEDTVENINRDLLMKMIGDYEYLGVFFCEYKTLF